MALDPQLYRTALLDLKTGAMSREWIRFFDQLSSKLAEIDTEWTEWRPTLSGWLSMTVSGVTYGDAQYLKQGDIVFFKMYATMTLGGTASNQIFVPLPFPVAGTPATQVSTFTAANIPPGSSWRPGWGFCDPAGSLAKVFQANEANYTLGSNQILIEGFYRAG